MKRFTSYADARAAGMTFGGLSKAGHIEATDNAADLIQWLIYRSFTPFEAIIVVEDFRL